MLHYNTNQVSSTYEGIGLGTRRAIEDYMTNTKAMSITEHTIKIQREELYAKAALLRMRNSSPNDRVRGSSNGGAERADGYHWRQCKRHMHKASAARKALALVTGGV